MFRGSWLSVSTASTANRRWIVRVESGLRNAPCSCGGFHPAIRLLPDTSVRLCIDRVSVSVRNANPDDETPVLPPLCSQYHAFVKGEAIQLRSEYIASQRRRVKTKDHIPVTKRAIPPTATVWAVCWESMSGKAANAITSPPTTSNLLRKISPRYPGGSGSGGGSMLRPQCGQAVARGLTSERHRLHM